jgi:hypothetical protein
MLKFAIDVGVPVDVGETGLGRRRMIPLLGGTVDGRWRGTVIPGGADWQTVRADGTLEIDARYVLALDAGRVEVHSTGLRSGPPAVLARLAAGEPVAPEEYYFRTAIRFRTAAPALAELNDLLAIARGERRASAVLIDVHPVL